MAVIDQYRNLLTVLTEFDASPSQVDDQIARLKEFLLETVKVQRGFVSANLHISSDRNKIINYSQWRTSEDYEAFLVDEELQAKVGAILNSEPKITLMTVALAT